MPKGVEHFSTAFIALGSNLGDRRASLDRALAILQARPGIIVQRVSSLYETRPVGGPAGQGPYLNAAAELLTDHPPETLLAILLETETSLGRVRQERDGPRTVDLDLLLYGGQVRDLPDLTLPHPRLHQRLFVLQPLAEIAPGVRHPVLGKTVAELLEDLLGVRLAGPGPGRELAGLRALVTGSTSGIGRAIALELAAGGADVIVHGRHSREAAEAVAAGVRDRGGQSQVLLVDLANPEQLLCLVEQAWDIWGKLDVWINNAGADTLTGEAARWPFERKLQRVAGRRCDRDPAAVPSGRTAAEGKRWRSDPEHGLGPGRDRHGGRQRRAVRGQQGGGDGLHQEPGPEPGAGGARQLPGSGVDSHGLGRKGVGVWQERVLRETPLRRWGLPEDVAATARWLCSPRASYLTGQVVRINGGAIR